MHLINNNFRCVGKSNKPIAKINEVYAFSIQVFSFYSSCILLNLYPQTIPPQWPTSKYQDSICTTRYV